MKRADSLLKYGISVLKNSGIDNYSEESYMIFESASGISKKYLILYPDVLIDNSVVDSFEKKIFERVSGRPLQYILGEWDFFGNLFYVGEGVLIPRPETEMIVEQCDTFISSHKKSVIYDLCSGSGCIGITCAIHNPECEIYLFEKSEQAFGYLLKNVARYNLKNVHTVKCDIFEGVPSIIPFPDVILSNPPYISTSEISFLQREVLREPTIALDGGYDGLDFYRAISNLWIPLINNGFVALECGEDQTVDVAQIISKRCINIKIFNDFSNLPRVVSAEVRSD